MNKQNRIEWHMGFYGAIELEFKDDKKYLEFIREHQLSKQSLKMDMLIIHKNPLVRLKNSIGELFREHNIIEYKRPGAQLGIDQFYKGCAYTCLYKSLSDKTDTIKSNEITLTFIRESYPYKLISKLKEMGFTIINKHPGIHYVLGNLLFPIQIIVSSDLKPKDHRCLRLLSMSADEKDAEKFIETASNYTDPGDKENADALLQVSVRANQKMYDKIKEDSHMCDALRELMKDEIEEEKSKAIAEGLAQGIAEGRAEGRALKYTP